MIRICPMCGESKEPKPHVCYAQRNAERQARRDREIKQKQEIFDQGWWKGTGDVYDRVLELPEDSGDEGYDTAISHVKDHITDLRDRAKGKNMKVDKVTTSVRGCSACGEDHEDFTFERINEPEEINGEQYNYAGPCPSNGVQVYLRFQSKSRLQDAPLGPN